MATAIEINGLSYTYPDGTSALRDIWLTIEEGESVALIGPNGAGKSTLIQHLNGTIHNPDGGRVRILGAPVIRVNLRQIRRQVGIVFQDPDDQLFSLTVREDVAFGPMNMGILGDELAGRVSRALNTVGLSPSFEGRFSHNLSIGEKKRVALATVLSMDATILALDEPASSLDPATRRGLIDLLRSLSHTRLMATHDLEMALEVCSRAILIDSGSIVVDGPPALMFGEEKLMAAHRLEVPLSLRMAQSR
jgi:cobalt/nickel transport system ATP-binding protein